MLQDILSIGDKVHIRPLDHTRKPIPNIEPFVSQLVDFGDGGALSISAPIINNQILLLELGRQYNLCFYTNKGLYQCNCEVIKKSKDNNIAINLVQPISELEKLQRRQYYRLEMIHDIEYRIIKDEEQRIEQLCRSNTLNTNELKESKDKLEEFDLNYKKTYTVDLSGGGTRFNSNDNFKIGDKLKIKLNFITSGMYKEFVIISEIVAKNKLYNHPGVYEYRVEFKNLQENDRDDIIKFIFEQERRIRKNDKG